MISKQEVEHIAKLSRLGLDKKEIEKFQKDLSVVLDYFDYLKEINTDNVEPMSHPSGSRLKGSELRDDKDQSFENKDDILDAVPDRDKRHVKVKTVF